MAKEQQKALANTSSAPDRGNKQKPKVDASFFRTLATVLKDGMGKRELFDLLALTGSLLARSLMSLWIAKNMGETIEHFCK